MIHQTTACGHLCIREPVHPRNDIGWDYLDIKGHQARCQLLTNGSRASRHHYCQTIPTTISILHLMMMMTTTMLHIVTMTMIPIVDVKTDTPSPPLFLVYVSVLFTRSSITLIYRTLSLGLLLLNFFLVTHSFSAVCKY